MNAMSLRKMIVAIALVGISVGYVRADKIQLQEKLSKDISIKLKDVTIAEALNKIGQESGVKIVLSDEAAWKLPQGRATRLSVALDGPLAGSITEMLNAFFMRYAVGDDEIMIYPRPELEHILGRPTTKQLELLKAIYTRPIKLYFLDNVQGTINTALGQEVLVSPIYVHAQLNNLFRQLVGRKAIYDGRGQPVLPSRDIVKTTEPEPDELQTIGFELLTPVTLAQLLSQVAIEGEEPIDTRWYISGIDFPGQSPEIRVVNADIFKELKLNQKVDISYKDECLNKILQDLASRAGAELTVTPGSYLYDQELSVSMQNITIAQAARNLANMFAAKCDIGFGCIEITRRDPVRKVPESKATTGKADDGGYVGKISIPMDDGKYFLEFMLREKDLTEELQKIRAEKMKEILGDLPEQNSAE